MRKTFLAICFSVLAVSSLAFAGVTELRDAKQVQQLEKNPPALPPASENVKIPADRIGNFLRERLSKLYISQFVGDKETPGSMDMQHSEEYIAAQKEGQKSTFQKIYEAAINRVSNEPQAYERGRQNQDIRYNQEAPQDIRAQEQEWQKPSYEVVNVTLPPNNKKEVVPAAEHIAYMFSDIEVSPSGLLHIKDTIVVVANGKKLKYGLSRAIPKTTVSRTGEKSTIDLSIVSVTLNGEPVAYTLEEDDYSIIMVPANKMELQPGVHRYEFRYVIDRRLWYYEDFNELYWDVTGSSWNLIITRLGAALTLPGGTEPLGYNVLTGYPGDFFENQVVVTKGDVGTTGFVSTRPLFVGEGMHIIASIPKNVFMSPTLGRMLSWFVSDFGDALFSIFGLLAILIAYLISWREMSSKKGKQKSGLRRNSVMMRYLAKGVYDKISFGAFLLELFRRNIIDIAANDKEILLVKKSDDLKGLSRKEKTAINDMFINKEAVMSINANNALKIKRAYRGIEADTKNKFKNFTLMLNFGYLFFSVGMLLLVEVFIAAIKVDFASNLIVMVASSLVFALCMTLFEVYFQNRIIGIFAKVFAAVAAFVNLFVLGIFVSTVAALVIYAAIYVIFSYTKLFGKRSGLVKNNIRESAEYGDFLLKNKDSIVIGRNFATQQPNIFALEVDEHFPKNDTNKEFYRLDIVKRITDRL